MAETDRLELESQLMAISIAVNKYFLALDDGKHGGVAQNLAFNEIQRIMGMSWERGEIRKRLDADPKMIQIFN